MSLILLRSCARLLRSSTSRPTASGANTATSAHCRFFANLTSPASARLATTLVSTRIQAEARHQRLKALLTQPQRRIHSSTPVHKGAESIQSLLAEITSHHLIVQTTHNETVLRVQLNRPQVHNAFNAQLIAELMNCFSLINSHVSQGNSCGLRCVVLSGAGLSFSAGADLNYMKSMANFSLDENRKDAHLLFAMMASIYNCPLPTVARVHGAALGGGVGLVATCDTAMATDDTVFGLTEVRLGLAPAVISQFVMQCMSQRQAQRYWMTGEKFKAREAKNCGIIHEQFANEQLLDAGIEQHISQLLSGGPHAQQATKHLLRQSVQFSCPDDSRNAVCDLIAKLRVSEEGQSGIGSFLNKQKPKWIKQQGK